MLNATDLDGLWAELGVAGRLAIKALNKFRGTFKELPAAGDLAEVWEALGIDWLGIG